MAPVSRRSFLTTGAALLLALAGFSIGWWNRREPPPPADALAEVETVPPGIILTEESLPSAPAGETSPGMRDIAGYGAPGGSDTSDMRLLTTSLSAFLTIHKQAASRPLSANGEWSAALRGQRPGATRWLEDAAPVFSTHGQIIDRHGTPVHFHALGHGSWEIRFAGPDRSLFTPDDTLGNIATPGR